MEEKAVKKELLSSEKLDRESPETEVLPGINSFVRKSIPRKDISTELSQEDIKLMYRLASLPTTNLIAEIKKIFDEGYDLGKSETKEMTRGKYLNIFSNSNRKYK